MLEQPADLEHFHRSTDLNFAMIRAKTGRVYYVNPYYIAAWSNVFQVTSLSGSKLKEDSLPSLCNFFGYSRIFKKAFL
uniref:Uncharacterized protein n=1 Tax=Parascaris equorum TaxID=6256 RepID=A0A914R1M4_PAREQ